MIRTICNVCEKDIKDVAYQFRAIDAQTPENILHGSAHLHWDCIPAYVGRIRSTERAEPKQ